jgi:uncharacterized membrane protein (DUF106 family)
MPILTIIQDANFFLEWMKYPPGSTIFVLLLATATGIISSLLNKWLIDTGEMERKQKQIKEHQLEKEKIIKLAETDVEKYRKERKRWERKDTILKQTQQSMALQRLKPTLVTFVPMIIIFWVLNTVFTKNGVALPVALSPMNPWDVPFLNNYVMAHTDQIYEWTALIYGKPIKIETYHGWINFVSWYFLCSLGVSTIIQRLLKLQTQSTGGMDQMFGQRAQYKEFPNV